MNGLLLGIPQTLSYFERMQERIINFVSKNSRIKPERFRELMMKKDELVMDVGSVLDGETAVNEGLIDSLGGLSDAVQCLYSLIEQQKTDKESTKRTKYSTGKTVSKKRASSATAKTDTKTAGKGKATARVSTFREYHPSAQRAVTHSFMTITPIMRLTVVFFLILSAKRTAFLYRTIYRVI